MTKEKEIIIISGFIGFAIGVRSMMIVNVNTKGNCYKIIEEIQYQVCENCYNNVFNVGEEYKEIQNYIDWE